MKIYRPNAQNFAKLILFLFIIMNGVSLFNKTGYSMKLFLQTNALVSSMSFVVYLITYFLRLEVGDDHIRAYKLYFNKFKLCRLSIPVSEINEISINPSRSSFEADHPSFNIRSENEEISIGVGQLRDGEYVEIVNKLLRVNKNIQLDEGIKILLKTGSMTKAEMPFYGKRFLGLLCILGIGIILALIRYFFFER